MVFCTTECPNSIAARRAESAVPSHLVDERCFDDLHLKINLIARVRCWESNPMRSIQRLVGDTAFLGARMQSDVLPRSDFRSECRLSDTQHS